ncbi:hypothetical protein Ancab_013235 [Ancistrocladus abbreviatus]
MGKKGYIAPAGEAELLAAVSSVKSKTAGGSQRQSWILFDSSGQSTILDVDKYAIIRRVHINARVLRILDPNLSYPPAILGRGKAIVLNLESFPIFAHSSMSEERMGTSFWHRGEDAGVENVTFPKFTLPFSTYSPKPTLLSLSVSPVHCSPTVRRCCHRHHTNSVIGRNGETFTSQIFPDELRRNSCESSVKPFKGRIDVAIIFNYPGRGIDGHPQPLTPATSSAISSHSMSKVACLPHVAIHMPPGKSE